MLHDLIHKDRSGQVADHLVNIDNRIASFIVLDVYWFDVGIQHTPLASPIVAHLVIPMNPATLHSIGQSTLGIINEITRSMSRLLNAA
jgi:hypothetical protein